MLHQDLIQPLLDRAAAFGPGVIEVINLEGVIVASSDPSRVNLTRPEVQELTVAGVALPSAPVPAAEFHTARQHPQLEDNGGQIAPFLPITVSDELTAWLGWQGVLSRETLALLQAALVGVLTAARRRDEQHFAAREEEALLNALLDREAAAREEELKLRALNAGYDLNLPRAVIVLRLEPKENSYFNINLHLGYDVTREQLKGEIWDQIKGDLYLTAQDLIAFHGEEHLVICKAFLNMENPGRLYQALDVMGKHLYELIKDNHLFAVQAAYGSIVAEVAGLRQSYLEAVELISLGRSCGKMYGFIDAEAILFEALVCALPGRLTSRYLEPLFQRIETAGEEGIQLLDTIEVYIDNNMNIKQTADKLYLHRNTVTNRLERLKQLTGLDPDSGFCALFWLKMLAIYRRLAALQRRNDPVPSGLDRG
ncbi:helix-turn-helix domain-containing protein [Moorella naiadis]|uniref:PucR family transcriptional regulator n=1 Tax=Moorella naiadis (nom. illeg.) TaxID=3093670 RepID=UPI003D9C9D1A